jgi:hypothetical protein
MAVSTICARASAACGSRGRFQQARQKGGFRQAHVPRRLAEIAPRRRFHAVGAGAEVDAVEIHLEDLVFRVLPFDPEGEQRLLHLALDGAIRLQIEILDQLLRDRRAALRNVAGDQVAESGPRQADRIHAPMRIEPPVLDGDDCPWDVRRHFAQRERLAARRAAIGEQAAIDCQNLHVGRAVRDRPGRGARQLRTVIGNDPHTNDACPQAENQRPVDETAQQPAPLATRICGFAGGFAAFLAAAAGQNAIFRRQRQRRGPAPALRRVEPRLHAPATLTLAHPTTLAKRSNRSTRPRL